MTKLPRRRYQELVRFWKQTLTNSKVSHRVRMSAAQRLDDLYRRHEFYEQQAESRKAKAETLAAMAHGQEGAIAPQESVSERLAREQALESERMQEVFSSILAPKEIRDTSADAVTR